MDAITKARIALKAAEIIGYERLSEVNFKLAMDSMEIIKNETANNNQEVTNNEIQLQEPY